jgi:hypothetical protein
MLEDGNNRLAPYVSKKLPPHTAHNPEEESSLLLFVIN